MAAWADYPEDELPELNINSLNHDIAQARQRLSALLAQFDTGRAVTQGVDTVICGRPNVGKSTLMNLLFLCRHYAGYRGGNSSSR